MQAKDIITLALAQAKAPGMRTYGGQQFNLELEQLCLIRDLQINRVTTTIAVGPASYGPYALESNYLRTYDLFYPIPSQGTAGGTTPGGITQFLTSVTMEQFDAEFKSPSVANYPYEYACDLSVEAQTVVNGVITSVGGLYIYPQSSGQIVLTHRYMISRAPIATPENSTTVPWMPYTDYLVEALSWRMMGITGDKRKMETWNHAEEMLRPWLIQEGDEQKAVHRITLDPKHFRPSRGLKPVKSYPY